MVSVAAVVQNLDIFPAWMELVHLVWVKLCSVPQIFVIWTPLAVTTRTQGLSALVGVDVVVEVKAGVSSFLAAGLSFSRVPARIPRLNIAPAREFFFKLFWRYVVVIQDCVLSRFGPGIAPPSNVPQPLPRSHYIPRLQATIAAPLRLHRTIRPQRSLHFSFHN